MFLLYVGISTFSNWENLPKDLSRCTVEDPGMFAFCCVSRVLCHAFKVFSFLPNSLPSLTLIVPLGPAVVTFAEREGSVVVA